MTSITVISAILNLLCHCLYRNQRLIFFFFLIRSLKIELGNTFIRFTLDARSLYLGLMFLFDLPL